MHDKIAMGKKLAAQVGQYKKHALLSPLCAFAAEPELVPSVAAPSALLMEKLTGQIIYEKNA